MPPQLENGLTAPGLIHGRAWVACDATTTLGERLVKIGAMVVARGCDVTFQLAGVAVSSSLFADILCLIGGRHRCRHDDPSGNILITRQHSWVLRTTCAQVDESFGLAGPEPDQVDMEPSPTWPAGLPAGFARGTRLMKALRATLITKPGGLFGEPRVKKGSSNCKNEFSSRAAPVS